MVYVLVLIFLGSVFFWKLWPVSSRISIFPLEHRAVKDALIGSKNLDKSFCQSILNSNEHSLLNNIDNHFNLFSA